MPLLKILVIDDNEAHASGLTELLALSGFEADYCLTAAEGLRRVLSNDLDAVLLDIHLPDLSGYEVCRLLRQNPRTQSIAIVYHSGSEPRNMNHGGDAFLTFPVEIGHMSSVIKGSVARRSELYPPVYPRAGAAAEDDPVHHW